MTEFFLAFDRHPWPVTVGIAAVAWAVQAIWTAPFRSR